MSPDPGLPQTPTAGGSTTGTSTAAAPSPSRTDVELLVPGRLHPRILEVTPDRPDGTGDPRGTGSSAERPGNWSPSCSAAPRPASSRSWCGAEDGTPAVIANAPFLFDGTPMPTRYWLVDPVLREAVSRLESTGGVGLAEAAVAPDRIAAAHAALRGRARRADPGRPRRAPTLGRGRGDPAGSQVPPRPPGLVADRSRRPGGGVDRAADRPPPLLSRPGGWSGGSRRPAVLARADGRTGRRGRDRLRDELDPTARGRRGGSTARATHADHPARRGRGRHRAAVPRGHRTVPRGARASTAGRWTAGASAGDGWSPPRPHATPPTGTNSCGAAGAVIGSRARAPDRAGRGTALVGRGGGRARPRRRALPGAGHRRRLDRARGRGRSRRSRLSPRSPSSSGASG